MLLCCNGNLDDHWSYCQDPNSSTVVSQKWCWGGKEGRGDLKRFQSLLKAYLSYQIRRQPTLWTGAPMSSLRLVPTTMSECRFGNSLSPSCSKETQPCPFTRGVLLQSFVDPFHQWCLKHTIYQMQVLWPPGDKTAGPDLCSWILPERDYWRAFIESSCSQLPNLWH